MGRLVHGIFDSGNFDSDGIFDSGILDSDLKFLKKLPKRDGSGIFDRENFYSDLKFLKNGQMIWKFNFRCTSYIIDLQNRNLNLYL